jgi:hypothetical protein
MRKLGAVLPVLVAIAATWWVTSASAQSTIPNGVFVQNSAGLLWLVLDGQRVKIPVWPASDDDIAALPVPDRWAVMNDAGAIVAGDAPAWLGSAPVMAAPDFSAFVGWWSRRDAQILIGNDGHAAFGWKVGACPPLQPGAPCDQFTNNSITYGGQAQITLSRVTGPPPVATGQVTTKNASGVFSIGPISITLVDQNLVRLQQNDGTTALLCRPPHDPNSCEP